jgi:hypothetical protein
MNSAKGSRTTRKRRKNRVHFSKRITTRISMKEISFIVKFWTFLQFLFKCSTICLNEFYQTKPKIIADVLQHICFYGSKGSSNLI